MIKVIADTTIAGRRVLDILVPDGVVIMLGDEVETDAGRFVITGIGTKRLPEADIAVVVRRILRPIGPPSTDNDCAEGRQCVGCPVWCNDCGRSCDRPDCCEG